jgi:hypothetical protein
VPSQPVEAVLLLGASLPAEAAAVPVIFPVQPVSGQ